MQASADEHTDKSRAVLVAARTQARHLNWKAAADLYTDVLELDAQCTDAVAERGRAHFQGGEYEQALNDAELLLSPMHNRVSSGLQLKAESLFALGHFEFALVVFHRGYRMRPCEEFRQGIQKSSAALETSFNSVSDAELLLTQTRGVAGIPSDNTDDATSQADTVDDPPSDANGNSNSDMLPAAAGDQGRLGQLTSVEPQRQHKAASRVTSSDAALLGGLHNDRVFLQQLLEDPVLIATHRHTPHAVLDPVRRGLEYIEQRVQFWRHRKPFASHLHGASRQIVSSRIRPMSPFVSRRRERQRLQAIADSSAAELPEEHRSADDDDDEEHGSGGHSNGVGGRVHVAVRKKMTRTPHPPPGRARSRGGVRLSQSQRAPSALGQLSGRRGTASARTVPRPRTSDGVSLQHRRRRVQHRQASGMARGAEWATATPSPPPRRAVGSASPYDRTRVGASSEHRAFGSAGSSLLARSPYIRRTSRRLSGSTSAHAQRTPRTQRRPATSGGMTRSPSASFASPRRRRSILTAMSARSQMDHMFVGGDNEQAKPAGRTRGGVERSGSGDVAPGKTKKPRVTKEAKVKRRNLQRARTELKTVHSLLDKAAQAVQRAGHPSAMYALRHAADISGKPQRQTDPMKGLSQAQASFMEQGQTYLKTALRRAQTALSVWSTQRTDQRAHMLAALHYAAGRCLSSDLSDALSMSNPYKALIHFSKQLELALRYSLPSHQEVAMESLAVTETLLKRHEPAKRRWYQLLEVYADPQRSLSALEDDYTTFHYTPLFVASTRLKSATAHLRLAELFVDTGEADKGNAHLQRVLSLTEDFYEHAREDHEAAHVNGIEEEQEDNEEEEEEQDQDEDDTTSLLSDAYEEEELRGGTSQGTNPSSGSGPQPGKVPNHTSLPASHRSKTCKRRGRCRRVRPTTPSIKYSAQLSELYRLAYELADQSVK